MLSDYQHIINEFTFIMGTKGAFEFKVDGELLYSKKENGRHAEAGEILSVFKDHVGHDVATYPKK